MNHACTWKYRHKVKGYLKSLKGVSFSRNRCAALVGEYNRVICMINWS